MHSPCQDLTYDLQPMIGGMMSEEWLCWHACSFQHGLAHAVMLLVLAMCSASCQERYGASRCCEAQGII